MSRTTRSRTPPSPPVTKHLVSTSIEPMTNPTPTSSGPIQPGPDVSGPDRLPAAKRRRPPPGRISPEALAARRGGAVEGLAWLGRPPEAKASLPYRLLRLLARFVLFVGFRFRIETSGQEHLPAGGYLLVGAAHRGWMDPFLVLHALPSEPR